MLVIIYTTEQWFILSEEIEFNIFEKPNVDYIFCAFTITIPTSFLFLRIFVRGIYSLIMVTDSGLKTK